MDLNEYITNLVNLQGEVEAPLDLVTGDYGKAFYYTFLAIERLSGKKDHIPVVLPANMNKRGIKADKVISVKGQYRSYNEKTEKKTRLRLFVYAMEVNEDVNAKENEIFLNGYVCKIPQYRKTPLGREITDILLAVNRPDGKSDYIPCICWGKNARFASEFNVGSELAIRGRIQSREYIKMVDGCKEIRTAYEISASQVLLG